MMLRKKFFSSIFLSAGILAMGALIGVSFVYERDTAQENLSETSLFVMDTYCTVSVGDASSSEVSRLLYELEGELDGFDPESDVSRLNQGRTLNAGSRAADLIRQTLALQERIPGGVDVTSGSLTALWGITTENPHVPDDAELKAALGRIGAEHVQISGGKILLEPGTQIDLGAVAKGYALDCVRELLQEQGASYGVISMTSSMLLYGEKPEGEPFTIGIRDPGGDGTLGTVSADSCFLSTSGGYERFFTAEDGTQYSHILDPESGYPVETDLTTVTVFCDNGLLSDYLSTLIYMGGTTALEEHLQAEEYKIVAADAEGNLYVSRGLDFTPANSSKGTEEME